MKGSVLTAVGPGYARVHAPRSYLVGTEMSPIRQACGWRDQTCFIEEAVSL
jgi:hypothetical protein